MWLDYSFVLTPPKIKAAMKAPIAISTGLTKSERIEQKSLNEYSILKG
jgi:hypothetical protein